MNRLGLPILLALSLAAACSNPLSPNRDRSDLDAARRRWSARGYGPYTATVRTLCFCGNTNPIRVLVVGDTVQSAVDTNTGQTIDKRFAPTIESLFKTIEQAITKPAASLRVSYDAALGYPTEIAIDWIANAVDDEVTYTVSNVGSAALTGRVTELRPPRRRAEDPHQR